MEFKVIIFSVISVVSVFYTIFTGFELCLFLSSNRNGFLLGFVSSSSGHLKNLLINLFYVIAFIVLHSFLASEKVKLVFHWFGISPLHRSFYNAISCRILKLLMSNWVLVYRDNYVIWNFSDSKGLVIISQIFHICGWFSIFSTVYILDFFEFVGLKQVQYYMNNLGCPLTAKTAEAQSFFNNLRHPTATGFLIVFWCAPCMTIDRLFLASIFSIYLFKRSKINRSNYEYISQMYNRKNFSLKHG